MTAIPSFRPDGSVMDLAAPLVSDVVWPEIAAGLSKIARFNARPKGFAYSVAQHCVIGADALFAETGDRMPAAYFLLHDAHEALLGDVPRPTLALLEHHAGRRSGIRLAMQTAKAEIDAVIFAAARIIPLAHAPEHEIVKAMDERLLRAEARALFGPHVDMAAGSMFIGAADLPPPRLAGVIKPWGAMKAEEAWLNRLQRYLGIQSRGVL